MTMPARRIWGCYLVIFAVLLGTTAWFVSWLLGYTAGGAVSGERYYRAVYVLQSLGGPAASEDEAIPGRVPYTDAAESLLHHPDKIFVLRHVADELAEARRQAPKAPLFEAYARIRLGEREEAARLLTAYVVDNEYSAEHYALLARLLRDLEDYASLLIICLEWRERDPSCRFERIHLTWTALYSLQRYTQAEGYIASEGNCLGWRAQVYTARTALALGEQERSDGLLESALQQHAEKATRIRRLWERLCAL